MALYLVDVFFIMGFFGVAWDDNKIAMVPSCTLT